MALLDDRTQYPARGARDAIELLVEILSAGTVDLDREGFYSRLAEGVARIAGMRRVVIFSYDEATQRVEAAGAHGIELTRFADFPVGLESAPDAARALTEDTVIEVSHPQVHAIPAEFEQLVGHHRLVYVPISAGGRWPGLIIAQPHDDSPPLDEEDGGFLWMLGKILALASIARIATFFGERARELQRRIDLARDLHERVVQRMFGVSMALSPPGHLDDAERERCAQEVQIALGDLRSAIQRPLGPTPRATATTLAMELRRLTEHPGPFRLEVDGPVPDLPPALEPLAQSVLAEALRNARKHAAAHTVTVRARRDKGLLTVEIENDGVSAGRHAGPPGVGLRIAALEALHVGGLLEFGEREHGIWQVRLSVPDTER